MEFKLLSQIITTITAFIGMGLGFYNLFVERSNRKIKILVRPKAIIRRTMNTVTGAEGCITSLNEFNCNELDDYFAIEAVNISTFPVTIDNAGFEVRKQDNRMTIFQPIFMDNGSWPRRLEPRDSVTIYGSLKHLLKSDGTPKIKNAFVETSCGTICRGTSGALEGLINYTKQLQSCT